jgi:hypothetical protein
MIREAHVKGLIHAAMSALAVVEAVHSQTTARRVLNGVSAMYHAACVVYHFRYEDETLPLTNSLRRGIF